jgi:hypothetical protein
VLVYGAEFPWIVAWLVSVKRPAAFGALATALRSLIQEIVPF